MCSFEVYIAKTQLVWILLSAQADTILDVDLSSSIKPSLFVKVYMSPDTPWKSTPGMWFAIACLTLAQFVLGWHLVHWVNYWEKMPVTTSHYRYLWPIPPALSLHCIHTHFILMQISTCKSVYLDTMLYLATLQKSKGYTLASPS